MKKKIMIIHYENGYLEFQYSSYWQLCKSIIAGAKFAKANNFGCFQSIYLFRSMNVYLSSFIYKHLNYLTNYDLIENN